MENGHRINPAEVPREINGKPTRVGWLLKQWFSLGGRRESRVYLASSLFSPYSPPLADLGLSKEYYVTNLVYGWFF